MAENLSFTKQYETYTGKTLGNYYLERLGEQLETGPVFLARHARAGQFHHLRFLTLPASLTPEERLVYLGHFQREASQAATLQHVALLPLSDYGIYEGTPYLVTPDLPTRSLQVLLSSEGPMDARFAGNHIYQITAALEYAHRQGILHLNLNARNILIQTNGQLLVAEFGLVRMLSPQTVIPTVEQPPALENGSPLLRDKQGRPLYGLSLVSAPAPELLRGQPVDTYTDVYALGALLYHMLTGHRALRGETLQEIARQHLNDAIPVPPLSQWRQNLPAELDDLLRSALAKDPSRRLRYPGALANAYAQIITPGQREHKPFVIASAPFANQAPVQESVQPRQAAPQRHAGFQERLARDSQSSLSRRRAITLIAVGGGVAAVAAASVLLVERNSGSGSPSPVASTDVRSSTPTSGPGEQTTASGSNNGTVLAKASDVPVNSAKTFPIANSDNPGVLIHLPNNQFVAFNSTCTHAGCSVKYNPQDHLLECPCHNASYDPARNAVVVGGPAPAPLAAIAIKVNGNGTITTNG